MSKTRSAYFCQSCGHESPKFLGRCPSCGEWNTFAEELLQKESGSGWKRTGAEGAAQPKRLDEISLDRQERISTALGEMDRVLGGGLVPGSLVLIGGEPGIGKSTLTLQSAMRMKGCKVLYVTGEESEQQIRMRAVRLGESLGDCYVLTETSTQGILQHLERMRPDLVIVDSIQTLQSQYIESTAGSISQIRECTAELQKFAKTTATPVVLIGHITKDGQLAGPKVLEHMVDVVLQFEGDRNYGYRVLRASKNRYGSTAEVALFEMSDRGMREILNPSEILISHHEEPLSGVCIASTLEGLRPMLIEVQALVSTAAYGTPQRSATGFDLRRLNMLLAVLEKRSGFRLAAKDVFLNIAGGIRVDDPAIDLAVVGAVLSSAEDSPLDPQVCFSGEVGLSGEVRAVSRLEQRVAEAARMGFSRMFVPRASLKGLRKAGDGLELVGVANVHQLYARLFNLPL
ncbi:MAG TPA: DNA repair protein RadA [Bacteroidales bacterium]|nr:DNA repair protein RadA [Bacteroidales bacterium]HRZ76719.1 DNA repair protein RadA [Bacteroidales bacterium]